MNLIGISGSPNSNGNNEKVINLALDIAKKRGFEVEKIFLSEKTVAPCTDCGVCKDKEECSIDDDMNELYPLLENADGIIVSSPVYFGSVSAQLKALFDRTLLLRRKDFSLKNKIGGAIAIGRSRNGGQEKTIGAIQDWMHIHGMIVVGDNNHFGGILQAPIEKDEIGLQTATDTANKVCEVLNLVKSKE
ncbi:MAG: flavodoxin family protein [Methanosarcinales archaeon]